MTAHQIESPFGALCTALDRYRDVGARSGAGADAFQHVVRDYMSRHPNTLDPRTHYSDPIQEGAAQRLRDLRNRDAGEWFFRDIDEATEWTEGERGDA